MRTIMMTPFIGDVLVLGAALAIATLAYLVCDVPMSEVPVRGARGVARTRAQQSGLFRWLEPVLRILSTHSSRLPLAETRTRVDRRLVTAGEFHGLTPDEFIVFSAFSSLTCAAVGVLAFFEGHGTVLPLACIGLGPFLPWVHVGSLIKARHKAVQRGLPGAIDLASLCMGAGLDFPGALRQVVDNMPSGPSPVREELTRLLQELRLGRTRKQALQSFAKRVDTEAVREFVGAVVQSEDKGTPLSEILVIQAEVLRNRRSVLAEEAAARAGVMLMLPMLMMVVSIVLLLMGPLMLDMAKGEML